MGVPHVVQDFALSESKTSRCEDAGVLCFAHERAHDRNPSGVGRDGVLDKVWLVVKAEVVE